jgi:hypothetical protein
MYLILLINFIERRKLYLQEDLGRSRRRWEDNIRMDLKEIGINMRNWVYLAQDRD